ncbi:MAG: hypothetical protein LBT36_05310 [Oscillospiraceae bacterium]|jgi:hypothetical protein|nr:hypothetical protein [Oscillospiraceae bacterium]
MGKFEKQFNPFIQLHNKDDWYGYTHPRMTFFNSDDVIPDVPFGAGFLVADKVGTMDIPHIHDGAYNFFVFTGAELDRIFEAEFEVGFCIGDSASSMEIYHITKPSIVCAPPGVFHSPVYFKKVVRGLNTMLTYVGTTKGRVYSRNDADGKEEWLYEFESSRPCIKDPDRECTFCGLCFTDPKQTDADVVKYMEPYYKNASTIGKYKDCIQELRKDYHTLGDAIISPRAVFKGNQDMAGTGQQFSFNIVTKPCKLGDDEPVSNGQFAEFLWFSGTDVVEPWDCFDAEIEIMLGEDPEHMEAVTFDKPGVIAIPAGMWRGAITVKRLGKPVCFIPYYTQDKLRYKLTQKVADGKKLLVYDDETTITNPTAGDELFLQIKR